MLPQRSAFRFRRNFLAALGSELLAPALRAGARLRSGPASPPSEWRSVLLLGATHIGDLLWRTASLPHLRRALPDCRLYVHCAPEAAATIAMNPYVDEVLASAHLEQGWHRVREGAHRLERIRFDAALCASHIRYLPDLLLAARLGISNRVAYTFKGFSGLVTHPIDVRYPMPMPAYFRAMVAQLGGLAPTWDLTPQMFPSAADEQQAAGVWEELRLDDAPVVVACALTTRQPAHVWPPDAYLRTLELLARDVHLEAVLCGGSCDAPLLERVAAASPVRSHVLAGRLGLAAFGAFLRRCTVLLATDSGPRHIANAVGTPVAFVRNLGASRVETGAYCANEIDVSPDAELLPYGRQSEALQRVTPERVASRLRELIARRRPEAFAGRGIV
jgi:ADP-heptose:LPS heptosyltransferase